MDFSGYHYYKLNRILLSSIGLWPQSMTVYHTLQQIQVIILSFILISITSPQLIKLTIREVDTYDILRTLSTALPFMLFTVKYITFYFITKDIKILMEQIRNDWNAMKDNNELEIIRRYTKAARLFTVSLATLIYTSLFIVICIQYVPLFVDIFTKQISSQNKSERFELLFQGEYFVDQEEYYYSIQFHINLGLFVAGTITLATESFSLAVAIHAFGMFKIASYRMEHIINGNTPNTFILKDCFFYDNVVAAIKSHRRAIEFADIMKTIFAIPYLALILLGVISTSVNLFLLFETLMSTNAINGVIICFICVSLHFIYMFLTNYAGQKFIDYSAELYGNICIIQWYCAPLQTQKLILFIMQKAIKNYNFNVGGLYRPSLEGFTTLASASLTYFTVLCSIRK